jgi:ribonuclease E
VLESSTEPCSQCGGSGHVRSVSSVALQLLRGLEEILMKGATHNLVVRTRTDVALYVLNHKRGHLRDLENSFKVTLAVIADATVSGQQSFIIDRGEQVHTLEAAKALLASQVAAFPVAIEDTDDEDEPFDIEVEAEVESEETEGLADESPGGEATASETDSDGQKRKRRRRRRGRPGEPREGGPARVDSAVRDDSLVREAPIVGEAAAAVGDDNESDEEETDEQPGMVRADQAAGERRPRRRGRRGGRRRRGGVDDGLVGSIADEMEPPSAPEASSAVADFDGSAPAPVEPPETDAQPVAIQHDTDAAQPEPVAIPVPTVEENAQEAERAARRRSTVREKVSFLVEAQPESAAASASHAPEPSPAAAPSEPAPASEPASPAPPRRAGWWSRRFGGGE